MTKLKLNREYAMRHLGVALLMLGLSGWFAYDGFVKYPAQPVEWFEAQHLVKDRAIRRQKEFCVLALLAALVIGFRLKKSADFAFEYDDENYRYRGETKPIAGIKTVDLSKWEKKGIAVVDGITLDAWHHLGVKEFVGKVKSKGEKVKSAEDGSRE